MSPTEDGDAVAEMERRASDALCAYEAEAQTWRLRCFEAQTQLRLLRQRRREEYHPRWPATDAALEELLNNQRRLQAKLNGLQGDSAKPLRALVSARLQEQQIENDLGFEEQEIIRFKSQFAEEEQALTAFSESRESVDNARFARQQALVAERTQAASAFVVVNRLQDELQSQLCELSDLTTRRDGLLAEQTELKRDCHAFEMDIAAERPQLQELHEECCQLEATAERVRTVAQKRTEAVNELEDQISSTTLEREEQLLQEEHALADSRAELQQLAQSIAEMDEQARRARAGHVKQVKAARDDGSALKNALADSEIEHQEILAQVERARLAADSHAGGHEERQNQQRVGAAVVADLEAEIAAHMSLLEKHVDEHDVAQTHHQTTEAALSVLLDQHGQLNHHNAASEASVAEQDVQQLQSELVLARAECSVDACKLRAERLSLCREEACSAEQDGSELAATCESLRYRLAALQEQMRERQLVSRRAVLEAAQRLKATYSELLREIRSGKARSTIDGIKATNSAAKRIGRVVDDLLRFVDSSSQMPTQFMANNFLDANGESAIYSTEQPRFPETIMEAASQQYQGTEDGSKMIELLSAEKQKVVALRKKMQHVGAKHSSELEALVAHQATVVTELSACEETLQGESAAAAASRSACDLLLQDAGTRSTDCQMRAVADIEQSLRIHSNEISRLRVERAALQARRLKIHTEAVSKSTEFKVDLALPSAKRLQFKEQDVLERRKRINNLVAQCEDFEKEVTECDAIGKEDLALPQFRCRLALSSSEVKSSCNGESPSTAPLDACIAEAIAKAATAASRTPPSPAFSQVVAAAAAAAVAATAITNTREGGRSPGRNSKNEPRSPPRLTQEATSSKRGHRSMASETSGVPSMDSSITALGFETVFKAIESDASPRERSVAAAVVARNAVAEAAAQAAASAVAAGGVAVTLDSVTSSNVGAGTLANVTLATADASEDLRRPRPTTEDAITQPMSGGPSQQAIPDGVTNVPHPSWVPQSSSDSVATTAPQCWIMQGIGQVTSTAMGASVSGSSSPRVAFAASRLGPPPPSPPPSPGAAHKAAMDLVASMSGSATSGAAGCASTSSPSFWMQSSSLPSSSLLSARHSGSRSTPILRPSVVPQSVLLPMPAVAARSSSPMVYRHTVTTSPRMVGAPQSRGSSPRRATSPPRAPADGRMVWAAVATTSPRSASPQGGQYRAASQARGQVVSWLAVSNEALLLSPRQAVVPRLSSPRATLVPSSPSAAGRSALATASFGMPIPFGVGVQCSPMHGYT